MDISTQFIAPVMSLVVWSLVIWVWMYITRIPAIQKMKMELDSDAPSGVQMSQLPPRVRWKADNYNHLMEQPTLFYAVAFSLALLGINSEMSLQLCWAYVALRVIHSLQQVLWNKIEVRFALFFLSNIPLFALAYIAAKASFNL